jgi:uncharacterized coiled-coil protein SlyX
MSGGKVISRKAVIVLGVVCIILAVGLVGVMAKYSSIIGEKDLQIASLNSQITGKDITISSLNSQIAVKDSEIRSLRDQIASLNSEIAKKNFEISSLTSQIIKLNYSYSSLKSEYDSVKKDYDRLLSAISKGEIVAKSATWLSEDKRLKVTSKIIPEFLFGELSSYTVEVTVTNIGAEPLSKVLIFLFPYKDDKFAEYLFTYRSASMENLYMGESYSYKFTWISKEMTTYKVIVVAG